jgi:hypothetical protein
VPFFFDESQRPREMFQGSRRDEPEFPDAAELLYRRCDPEHVEEGHILPIAVAQFNLSVLRSRFCSDPDHARWDSRVAAKNGKPFVYPDWHVIQISVGDSLLTRTPENPAAQPHTLRPVHAPLSDNYAHSELGLFKGTGAGQRILKEGDAKGEGKLAKKQFRTILAERAVICLHANEGSSFVERHDCRLVTKEVQLHASADSESPRRGRLRARSVVQVLERSGRWVRVRSSTSATVEGWIYRRRLRRGVKDC